MAIDPRGAALERFAGDGGYQQVPHLRTQAPTEALLQPTTSW